MSEPRPPKDDLVRAIYPGFEVRSTDEGGPTMFGHFAKFNDWTTIDSAWEGRFLERIAPGAFTKTFQDRRDQIQILFQHGQDPEIGDKIIGSIKELREDDQGAYYEAELFDGIPPLVLGGLKAGKYGSSFRFKVMRETFDDDPGTPPHNPEGLPERTVKEVNLFEFGPVTFPQYASATASIRSLTDEFIIDRLRSKPDRLRELIASVQAPSDDAEPGLTSPERREDAQVPSAPPRRFRNRQEYLQWISKI